MKFVVLTHSSSAPFFYLSSSPFLLSSSLPSLTPSSLSVSNSLSLSLPLFDSLIMETKSRNEEGKRSLIKEKTKKAETAEDGEEEEGFGSGEDEKKKKPMLSSGRKGSSGSGVSSPCCQAEKCTVDLTDAKRYHRRHKVCEHHSKAPVVIVAGLRQRFCQQCSRFHEVSEFDEAKRSCRSRLAGHNERRRKNSSESHGEGSTRKGLGPQLKENHCRQADQSGRMPITAPENATYKHFQIR